MLRERHINGDPRGRGKRFLIAVADLARWPFERAAWALERGLLWPLQERFAGRAPAARSAGAGALAAIAGIAVLAGALLLPGDDEQPPERAAAPARVALATPEPRAQAEEPSGPVLRGVPPDFSVGKGVGVAPSADNAGDEAAAPTEGSDGAAPDSGAAAQPEGDAGAAATSSSKKPVPAGPAAMKVARRFSEAFVFYEIGERPARARTVFGETATPQLAAALGERPPRQPSEGKVPKARVLNLVAGPRAGKAYTVSASLLRVGLTSELRLELSKKRGAWLVTDVRG
ncbi:MAG: hypothetical protein WDZ46_09020 [Solirubrobacterales bacterium]